MFWCSHEQDEMVKVIYKIADNDESHDPDTEEEDAETRLEAQHTGGDTAWSRWYRLIAVCLVMLCLLLTAVIVLWINYHILKESQTSKCNLTKERDQLQTCNNNLTTERDQSQTCICNLTIVRDQLQRKIAELQKFLNLGWNYFNSSVYIVINELKTWTESRKSCTERGADLVIINSKEEQEFVTKLRGAGGQAWIGLSGSVRENKWKWVDDTTLITGFWYSEEPNSAAGEDRCVITGKTSDSVKDWGVYSCSDQYKYICEKKIFN
ncbi:C-type lectin domain family 4 member C-like [Clarias gariepinus]|uniref:C-type lectin domain family 4 member C-like n=1 Tax=Clarias gariepinus TaxID=13013 RepID=UPI00234CD6E0|nr:C-type lectin domain family 4 member C-like [Clarias gariepinus]